MKIHSKRNLGKIYIFFDIKQETNSYICSKIPKDSYFAERKILGLYRSRLLELENQYLHINEDDSPKPCKNE